ncbi:MAG TPA: DegT/DnrJ/EryC1/StrS family aminotransferase [Nitrospirota bacterium]|nr:DegT/DnrJ/EryC1/StrS family aminotransferase [Nitrospirota bacterium]
MNVPLLDLKEQYLTIKDEVVRAMMEVVEEQNFILGPKVAELERRVAEYSGASRGVGVSSGTDALIISLMAAGVSRGDYVVTTPYTFFATAGAVARLGAVPVFADIDPKTYNIDPAKFEEAAAKLPGKKLKAAIPVHLYGQCCEMAPVMEAAKLRGMCVIEDAAQAIGAKDAQGRPAGSIGDMGCFSFFPSKNMGGFGDGGMVVTRDDALAERMSVLRAHGSSPKYYHKIIGGNFRLDALQAAVLGVKLRHLDSWSEARRANAALYDRLINEAGLPVVTPYTAPGHRHIYNQYVIRAGRRDGLAAHLKSRGVGTEVYYPLPMHMQECFRYLGYVEGDFPESERAAKETLALPVYPELSGEKITYVVDCLKEFYA